MPKLVVVTRKDTPEVVDRIVSQLGNGCELVIEHDLAGALLRLTEPDVVGIVADRSVASPTPEMPVAPATVLDAISEGLVVVDRELKVLWMNRRLRDWGDRAGGYINSPCFRIFHDRAEVCPDCEALETFRTGKRAVRVHQSVDGRFWESVSSPIFDEGGRVSHVLMVVRDVSERVFLESRIESIYRAGVELSRMEPAELARKSVDERIEMIKVNVISHTQKLLPFDSLLIRQLDERTGELRVMIREGYDPDTDELLRRKKVFAAPEGQGITGYVAASGKSYLCRDAETDPLVSQPTVSFRSQVTVPLRWQDKVIGTMGVRSRRRDAYSTEDVKFLEIYASFVAQALNTANLIRLEHAFTYERVAEQLADEIANPLNAVINDVYLLLQEYIGHDSNTISKLRDIEHNIDRVREVIRRVTEVERPDVPGTRLATDSLIRGKHILVADDDEAIRRTMSDILAKDGCVVETAADGQELVNILQDNPNFDLLLSDIKMPKRSGYEVYDYVRAHLPNMPVILMTAFGYDPDHSIVEARRKGLEVILFKPFKVSVLRQEVRKALKAGEAARAE